MRSIYPKTISLRNAALALACGLTATSAQSASGEKPTTPPDNIWAHYLASGTYQYYVDDITQICSLAIQSGVQKGGLGVTKIDCADLAKREEWKKIITWVK